MESELVKYVIEIDQNDEKLIEYAISHINENPDTNLEILSEFRDYIYERGECNPARMDDVFLLRFLRAREFIIKRAHRLLVNNCNFKENNKDLYDVSYERLHSFLKLNIFTSMPFCDQENRRICIFRPGIWNPDEFSAYELLQFFLFVLEVCIWEPRSQITGIVGIFDLSSTTLRQALYFTPSTVNKIFHLLLWSYPSRIHKIHIINDTSIVFNVGVTFFRPFFNEEIQKSLFFHGADMNSLHEHIDPKYLPERYGGVHPDYTSDKWLENIATRTELLDELNKTDYNFGEELVSKNTNN